VAGQSSGHRVHVQIGMLLEPVLVGPNLRERKKGSAVSYRLTPTRSA
jgi:hypothetical protein